MASLADSTSGVIVKSVSPLTPADVVKLLKFFVLQIQSRGAVLGCLLRWLQTLLGQHMSSIVSRESSMLVLNSLYQDFTVPLEGKSTYIIYKDKDTDEEESEVDAMETYGEAEELEDFTDASKHSNRSEIMND
ncbi:hypothetical protein EJB05_17690, partial [Eragrostis curvula]